jgi:hypothetical protein
MSGPLANLPRIQDARSRRVSSWDRTGGNDDNRRIAAGVHQEIAMIDRAGIVRHIWMTAACEDDPLFLRKAVFRVFWDGETMPSVEVPLGDFFGLGHATTRNFWSLPLQMSPQDGRGFNCWFPMPFEGARFEIENEADGELLLYFYIDYEEVDAVDPGLARFHAQWRRERCVGIDDDGLTNASFQLDGTNLTGDGNYTVLEAVGRGHYVGCTMAIENRRSVGSDTWNWYGEGDDMIFVDGEAFPPSLHGTGTEDYFGTAWCPTQEYSGPYHGIVMGGGANWSENIALYRFHIEDPVRFRESIRVTIEHGHANRRSDDLASVAYWYQLEPHAPFPRLPAVADRLPTRPGPI